MHCFVRGSRYRSMLHQEEHKTNSRTARPCGAQEAHLSRKTEGVGARYAQLQRVFRPAARLVGEAADYVFPLAREEKRPPAKL